MQNDMVFDGPQVHGIHWNGNGVVSFLYNGKQVVICNGIIVIEEA